MDIEKLEKIARERIKSLSGTDEGELGPNLFVSHHLEEIEEAYWTKTFGTKSPSPDSILDSLVLINSWGTEDDGVIDTLDFSLPGDITNYLICVRFEDGDVSQVSLES